jgi:hypothetical protein
MAAHVALCDMAMLARLAGEEALQAECSGLVTSDDVRGRDSHDFPSHEPVMSALAENALICVSLASPVHPFTGC